MRWRAGPRRIGAGLAPDARSWAKVKSFTNGPSPTLIGPVVKRRHSLASKPPTAARADSSGAHELGSWPPTDPGGLTVSGGYRPLSGLAGATKPNSNGGTAL